MYRTHTFWVSAKEPANMPEMQQNYLKWQDSGPEHTSEHETKMKSIFFKMHIIDLIMNNSSVHNVLSKYIIWIYQWNIRWTSPIFFSFIFFKHRPFLTINQKLAFRSASIHSTMWMEVPVLQCFLLINLFHSDVHHNTEEKILHYYCYIAVLNTNVF